MADVKISALPAATTPLGGTEVLPIVQSSTTKKVSIADVTAGRAVSASSLTLTTPLAASSGGTGLSALGTGVATALGNTTNAASGLAVLNASGYLAVGQGGTGLGSLTAGYIPYGNGAGAFSSSVNFSFDGSTLTTGGLITSDDTNTLLTLGRYSAGAPWTLIRPSSTSSGFEFRTNGATKLYVINQSTTAHTWYSGGNQSMTITSGGLVGIGTSSPDRSLSVYTTDASGKVALFSNGNTNTNLYLSSDPSSGGGIINVSNNAASAALPLLFQMNGSEKMRLDPSGNLGLGVTPSAWQSSRKAFQLGSVGALIGDSTSTQYLCNTFLDTTSTLKYLTTNPASYYQQFNGIHSWYNAASGTAGATATFTQAMTLTAAGYLGIGLTNPGADIHLYRSGANPVLRIERASGAYFDIFATASAGFLSVVTNSDLVFRTNNTDALLISAAGWANVCAATATPAGGSTTAKLIFGTTAGFGIYYGSGAPTVSAAQGSIYLRSDGSSTSTRLYVNTNGSTTWTNVTTAA